LNLRVRSFLTRLRSFNSKSKFKSYPDNFAKILAEKLGKLEKLLGYKIKDPIFYVKAITHRSFAEFSDYNLRSNERLEFLGDSVLGLIIGEYVFRDFPEKDEGFLTKTRSQLVNRIALAHAAEGIRLMDYMLVSHAFPSMSEKGAHSIVSNALEALVGAIYLDKGLDTARKFVSKVIIKPGIKEGILFVDHNFKSQLLEFTQSHKLGNPLYKILKEEGPNHNKIFTVELFIDNISYGNGEGKNKKTAEQNAAQDALVKIGVMKLENQV